ncbi:MAG: hypothetical protein PHH49_06345 [Candidatus Omnitrophica bacterium]|nr:hypothetical protein [Candidatus Omnitrophota bacterium]MDD5488560.1 hypothetical protein [Candidatus Omnitrophota bacterium]
MIEGADKKTPKKKSSKPGVDILSSAIPDMSVILERLKARFGGIMGEGRYKDLLTVGNMTKALMSGIGVLVVWHVILILLGVINMGNIPKFEVSSVMKVPDDVKNIVLPLKDYGYYSDTLINRNIFKPYEAVKKERQAGAPTLGDMTKDLKLVGISWSPDENERYAMIEDSKVMVTYYAQEGDKVLQFIVKEITKDFITLGYGEDEVTLR